MKGEFKYGGKMQMLQRLHSCNRKRGYPL